MYNEEHERNLLISGIGPGAAVVGGAVVGGAVVGGAVIITRKKTRKITVAYVFAKSANVLGDIRRFCQK